MAAAGTEMNNDLGVDGNKQGGTEVKNGLVTPQATPAVEDGRIDAEKARQAAVAAAAETSANGQGSTETENHGGNESDSELSDYETDSDGDVVAILPEDEMDGVTETDAIPKPSKIIQNVYQEATPHLAKLMIDSTDLTALGALKALNDKIKQQNEKEENPPDGWIINVPFFASNFEMAKPYMDRLLKRGEGEPADQESVKKIDEINAALREINTKHHYPQNWLITPPSEEVVAQAQAAKKEADEALTKRKAEKRAKKKADKAAADKAAADKPLVDKAAADKAAADKAAVDKAAVDKAAVDKAAVDKAAVDKAVVDKAAARNFGNIKFPWVTYPLPTGERIIAGRQRTKDDVSGSLCCVELPCTDPEDPNFEFRDDIDIIELQKYFLTPGIKLMGETDEKGRPVKVWRKVDRKDFREFKFCVVGKRERTDLRTRTKPVCPEVLCGVMMADGFTVLNKTGLLNMVGKKAEEGYIRRYCEKKGITSPWDVQPNSWTIATEDKELLDKLKSERLNSALPGNSEIKTEKIDTKEKINTSGSSLDSTLKKMEERMASMETKLAKVDELGTNVANITLLVQQLMKQAGLNAASG
jgi:hypothetical protein